MNFRKIYEKCNPILSFEDIYFECNVKPLVKQVLKERNNVPGDLVTFVKGAFSALWHNNIDDTFTIRIVEKAIKTASKGNGLHLYKSQTLEEIPINNETSEYRNEALMDIKAFVDSVISMCEKTAENYQNSKEEEHKKFVSYFTDKKRVSQLYTALARGIAKELKLFISKDEWEAAGFQPF